MGHYQGLSRYLILRQTGPALPGPYEILELTDGGTLTIRITPWRKGGVNIHPATPGGPVAIRLRGILASGGSSGTRILTA